MVSVSASSLKLLLVGSHFMQWASAVIVMGITSYYIAKFSDGQHLKYEEIISTMVTAFYLPSFVVPFLKSYRSYYLPLDFIFSYLWLTAFIFEAQDYNEKPCSAFAPPGATDCGLKHASESFVFLAFFFTLTSLILEGASWGNRQAADHIL
jgi:hypothetical protein